MARILILDDNLEVVDTIKGMLADKKYIVDAESNPARVMEKIRQFEPDLVTLDISFSEQKDETGIALLQEIREEYGKDRLPVLAISGTANADKLTRMMLLGVNGYLCKPVKQADLQKKIDDALESKSDASGTTSPWEIRMVGESSAILELILEIGKAAVAGSDLLVTGESGVGKEQVVQKYRELSSRKNKPFVVIDCTNIHHETFESEIFGHEKGAFTGASERKRGKIEMAAGGIVFFDEIGDLPEKQQSKLLRLLQEKTFTRMGSKDDELIHIDAVVLAATNKDLYRLMQAGALRKDIYYRLQYMKIEVPPLRDHLEDIPFLVEHFIQKANSAFRKSVAAAEDNVIQAFQTMKWNGNVRQLEKCVEYGVVKCEGKYLQWNDVSGFFKDEIVPDKGETAHQFDLAMDYEAFKKFLKEDREAKETYYYLHHLQRNHYNIQKTAKELGIARPHLNETMKRLEIKKG